MSVFRLAIIIIGLAAIAAGNVHLRWSNAHYAHLIHKQADRRRLLTHRYYEKRLELAKRKSPKNLLEQLKKWQFPLEGWIPSKAPEN